MDRELLIDICLGLLSVPIAAAIFALFLKILTKYSVRVILSYIQALKIQLYIGLCIFSLTLLSTFIIGFILGSHRTANAVSLFFPFFVGTPFYASMIIHPIKGKLGWIKGLLVSILLGTAYYLLLLSLTLGGMAIFAFIFNHIKG